MNGLLGLLAWLAGVGHWGAHTAPRGVEQAGVRLVDGFLRVLALAAGFGGAYLVWHCLTWAAATCGGYESIFGRFGFPPLAAVLAKLVVSVGAGTITAACVRAWVMDMLAGLGSGRSGGDGHGPS